MAKESLDPHHNDTIVLTGHNLTIEDVVAVARGRATVMPLGNNGETEVERRINDSAGWVRKVMDELAECLKRGEDPCAYYGINTGFGHLAGMKAFSDPEDARRLSRNLIASHSVGVGDFFEEEIVRAAMLIRANTLAKGHSGVRIDVINTLIEMLNRGVTPAVPRKGSVGASGDLAPLSHMVLVMSRSPEGTDEERDSGEVLVETNSGHAVIPGMLAMREAGIKRVVLGAKEGLALNNGATFSAAIAALALYDAENLVENAEVALAMSHEAMLGFRDPFLPDVHKVRAHPGQSITAERVLRLLQGSELLDSDRDRSPDKLKCPPQDAYSQRCAPQVIGAVRDTLRHVRRVVETELNAATDNPLIFADLPRDYKSISCGNFHGEPLAFAMDFLGIAITELGNIAERRIFKIISAPKHPWELGPNENPKQEHLQVNPDEYRYILLPDCLVDVPGKLGLNSGFMVVQYTAAALVSDCKTLAHPDSVDSIPTDANREDHVSMSTNAARHAREIVENITSVIAIELMCAAQAFDFRLGKGGQVAPKDRALGQGTRRAYERIRATVEHLDKDRILFHSVRDMVDLVNTGAIVQAAWGGEEEALKQRLYSRAAMLQAEIEALGARKRQFEAELSQLG